MSDSRLTPELIDAYTTASAWTYATLPGVLARAAVEHPERPAAVTVRAGEVKAFEVLTYRDLADRARSIGAGLAELGVGPGDGVAVILPNGNDFAAAIWAILGLGAVYTGIPVAYGEREIDVILRRSEARVVIVPTGFRSVGHLDLARRLRANLPALDHVVVHGEAELQDDEVDFERLKSSSTSLAPVDIDPAALAHVGFTSGTTGEPKGVMNSHQTLEAVMRGFVEHLGEAAFGQPAVNLVASPVGHHTGFLWGVLLTARLGGTAVFLERWSPANAAEVIREHGVTVLFGAPTFLQDLVEQRAHHGGLSSLETVIVAGAPVPDGLPAAAADAFGCWVCPAWGMTEWGIGISRAPGLEARGDGRPLEACEVEIRTEEGGVARPGEVGRLHMRGPGLFLGYKGRPDAMAEAFDSDGFFDTGDLAVMDEDGYVSLRGRTKDIIIRGGENIPVVEVESLLLEHSDVVEVAVVGVPDGRLGERAAAVVVPRGSATPDVASFAAYLTSRGMSKHYLPEAVVLVGELPKTPSGKIRKNELRHRLTQRVGRV